MRTKPKQQDRLVVSVNGFYSYRRLVPKRFHALAFKTAWKHSLGTKDRRLAAERANAYDVHYDQAIERMERGLEPPPAPKSFAQHVNYLRTHETARDVFFQVLADEMMDRLHSRRGVSQEDKEDLWGDPNRRIEELATSREKNVLAALKDGKPLVETVTLAHAIKADIKRYGGKGRDDRQFLFALKAFEKSNGSVDIRAVTRMQVMKMADDLTAGGATQGTVRKRVTCLRAVYNRWHRDNEVPARKPFTAITKVDVDPVNAKMPFHRTHLDLIDAYVAGSSMRFENRALLTVLRLTGARLSEVLGGTYVFTDGEPYLLIGSGKTKESRRRVPLVGAAIEAAKLIQPKNANTTSQVLNKALRTAGIGSKRLTVHSFRHTMIEALRSAGVAEHLIKRIVGHKGGSGVTAIYGASQADRGEMRDALLKAVPLLGHVAEENFRPDELSIDRNNAR